MINSTRKLYEVQELLTANGGPLPLSRAGIYNAVAKGDIPMVKIGRRVFVPSWYVEKLLMPPQGA
jgi:hypothetical protein